MIEKKIIVSKTMRYFTIGDIDKADKLLYVLHGYGQLASYFLKSFEKLSDLYFIVAPEGMHRFYLNGTSGRVGASWMTKEAREIDIIENTQNLNQLNKTLGKQFKKKVILGFSQGGATAARWYFNKKSLFDQLILWASVFPPDIDISKEISNNNKTINYFVLGDKDPYFNVTNSKEIINNYKKNHFHIKRFNGAHKIDFDTLKNILK